MSMMMMVQAVKTEVDTPLRKLGLMNLADNANNHGEHAVLNDIPDPLGHGDVF